MEIQNIYYRLWENPVFSLVRESGLPDIFNNEVKAACCLIRDNNRAFLKELENHKLDGYQSVVEWLDYLLTDYVRRSGGQVVHVWNSPDTDFYYYTDWLKNTLSICDNPLVVEFCNEKERMIKKLSGDSGNTFEYNPQNVQVFKEKVGYCLGKEETEHLLRILPKMKPKEVKAYYLEHPSLKVKYSLKEFFNLLESVAHRDGEKGWNYNNIK